MKKTLLFVGLLTVLWACSPKTSVPDLVVGMYLTYPPFEMIDAQGEPAGVSVELAEGLAKSLNRKLRIENIPFKGLIPSLQNGRIDCVISSMTATDERRKSLDFSDPYLTTGLGMLVGKESPIKGMGELDQPGKTVVVRQGTTGEVWARANIKQATILAVVQTNNAVLEVVQGRADAFIYDQMSVWQNWQKNLDTTKALLAPMQIEYWALGVRKGNEELKREINAFLKTFRAEGGFDRLREQFLKPQEEAFKEQGIPFYF